MHVRSKHIHRSEYIPILPFPLPPQSLVEDFLKTLDLLSHNWCFRPKVLVTDAIVYSICFKNIIVFDVTLLTHRYSVGVAVSYSRDFFICMKFCETIESSSLLFAVGLYIKCLDPKIFALGLSYRPRWSIH